jgi:hypothetical protein
VDALIAGVGIAVAALTYVLAPLFRGTDAGPRRGADRAPTATPAGRGMTHRALRQLELDLAQGLVAPEDYPTLRDRLSSGVRSGTSGDPLAGTESELVSDLEIEGLVSEQRARGAVCPSCGVRPESDAVYCSSCGRRLGGA